MNYVSLVDAEGSVWIAGYDGNRWHGGRRTTNDGDPDATPLSVASREYFRPLVADNTQGRFSVIVNEPYIPIGLTDKNIVISVPIIRGGRSVGVVNSAQTSKEISELYNRLTADFYDRFGSDAHMYVMSQSEQLVSSLQYDARSHSYADVLDGSNEIVYTRGMLPAELVEAFYSSLEQDERAITARIEGASRFINCIRINGTTLIESTPYAIGFSVSESVMLSSSRTIVIAGIVSLILIVVVMGFAMAMMTRGMVGARHAMNDTMQEIAAGGGDLTARIEVRGNDEIAEIGVSFNQFIGTLRDMIGNVSNSSDTLRERTEELAKRLRDGFGRCRLNNEGHRKPELRGGRAERVRYRNVGCHHANRAEYRKPDKPDRKPVVGGNAAVSFGARDGSKHRLNFGKHKQGVGEL